MEDCILCKIADKTTDSSVLWEDLKLLVFPDRCAIREGHCQIITKDHYETFEMMPPNLTSAHYITNAAKFKSS